MCQQLQPNCKCVNSLDAIIYSGQGVTSCICHVIMCRHLLRSREKFLIEYSQSKTNKMQRFSVYLFISVRCSTCFRRVFRPSSGAQNCTYSARYLSDQNCYLLLAWPGWNYSANILAMHGPTNLPYQIHVNAQITVRQSFMNFLRSLA